MNFGLGWDLSLRAYPFNVAPLLANCVVGDTYNQVLIHWHGRFAVTFAPLRRIPFVLAKGIKTVCPCIRPYAALRVPSLRHCSRRDRTEGPSWPYGARRPSMACTRLRNTYTQPTEGTIQVSELAMYETPDQKQKLHTSTSLLPLPLLCFYLHKSCRRHKSSLQ